jgi:hypothetical protein
MRDIDTRDGWKKTLEAMLPLGGTLVAFILMMVFRCILIWREGALPLLRVSEKRRGRQNRMYDPNRNRPLKAA